MLTITNSADKQIIVDALIERIKKLETDLYLSQTEVNRLKEQLAKGGEGVG